MIAATSIAAYAKAERHKLHIASTNNIITNYCPNAHLTTQRQGFGFCHSGQYMVALATSRHIKKRR